jgi:hypothetical protein
MPTNYKITESNGDTGITIERDATLDELAQFEIDAKLRVDKEKDLENKAQAKSALLERLGITADEAALLLS